MFNLIMESKCTVSTMVWIYMICFIMKPSRSSDIQCTKCLHMETTSIFASLIKLPSNPNCSKENKLGDNSIITCPNQTTDDKMFLCGYMSGNLSVTLKYLGIPVSTHGRVFYRDCVLVNKNYSLGCQQNITGPMEKALLHELGPDVPKVNVTKFDGAMCLYQSSRHVAISVSSSDPNLLTNPVSITNPEILTKPVLSSAVTEKIENTDGENYVNSSPSLTLNSTSLSIYFCFQLIFEIIVLQFCCLV